MEVVSNPVTIGTISSKGKPRGDTIIYGGIMSSNAIVGYAIIVITSTGDILLEKTTAEGYVMVRTSYFLH